MKPTSTLEGSSIEIHCSLFECNECTNSDQMRLKCREEMRIFFFFFFFLLGNEIFLVLKIEL
ncbi:hypothetical protein Scep_015626 [Stephania cephalantha]|uniref:Uncharacterized protein n=1 Tax=Stephania cephalantha TaxID=152367 RepID=A0AAP0J4Y7_9MAGN